MDMKQLMPDLPSNGSNKFETMPGSEKGSVFLVVAKKADMKLGVRPITMSYPLAGHERPFLYVAARIRVESLDGYSIDGEKATDGFGIPGLTEKGGKHVSTVCGVPVIALPASPAEIRSVIDGMKVIGMLASDIVSKCKEKGAIIVTDVAAVVEYMNLHFDTEIPQIEVDVIEKPEVLYALDDKKTYKAMKSMVPGAVNEAVKEKIDAVQKETAEKLKALMEKMQSGSISEITAMKEAQALQQEAAAKMKQVMEGEKEEKKAEEVADAVSEASKQKLLNMLAAPSSNLKIAALKKQLHDEVQADPHPTIEKYMDKLEKGMMEALQEPQKKDDGLEAA